MADGRKSQAWDHTASMLAMLHNVNQTKRGSAKRPAHFHPYVDRRADVVHVSMDEALRELEL